MLGIVITGHGEFSNGIYQAFKMIAGEPYNVTIVPFQDGMAITDFQEQLREKFERFSEQFEGIIVLTDLLGGTPFNNSMILSEQFEKIRVLTGTNLAMVIEGQLMALIESDVDKLAHQLVEVGQQAISFPQLNCSQDEEVVEEGI